VAAGYDRLAASSASVYFPEIERADE